MVWHPMSTVIRHASNRVQFALLVVGLVLPPLLLLLFLLKGGLGIFEVKGICWCLSYLHSYKMQQNSGFVFAPLG